MQVQGGTRNEPLAFANVMMGTTFTSILCSGLLWLLESSTLRAMPPKAMTITSDSIVLVNYVPSTFLTPFTGKLCRCEVSQRSAQREGSGAEAQATLCSPHHVP